MILRALCPQSTFEYRLYLPDGTEKIVLRCRFLTMRQTLELRALTDQAMAMKSDADFYELIRQRINLVVVEGRSGVGLGERTFNPLGLDDMLTPEELWRLPGAIVNAQALTELDLGKSPLPSTGAAGGSAKAAAPAGAGTCQTPPSPSSTAAAGSSC